MIFKSALITAGSGKIGGLVVSHNRGGNYARALRIPVNRRSGFQQPVRAGFGYLMSRWKTLDPDTRSGWDQYAANTPVTNALGDTIKLTGPQMYMLVNTPILQGLGITEVKDNPPATPGLTAVTPITGVFDASSNNLTLTFNAMDDWAVATGGWLHVYQSQAQPDSHQFNSSSFRYIASIGGDTMTPPTSPVVLTPLPFSVTGFAGDACWFKYSAVDAQGRPSRAIQVRCTIQA